MVGSPREADLQPHRIRYWINSTPKDAAFRDAATAVCEVYRQAPELWFSILARRFLRRASFPNVDDLSERLLRFIDYFNRVLAKPFDWTCTGRLRVSP